MSASGRTSWVLPPPLARRREGPVVITGGAGFVGTNLAHRLLLGGRRVILLDNLSRPGAEHNAGWLCDTHGSRVQLERGDVRRPEAVASVVRGAAAVFHFAAQAAVTTSLVDPRTDFETNALGTLNVLEALRSQATPPPLVFTSTNKVYGACDDLPLSEGHTRYRARGGRARATGVGERRPLDFHSPYGCSKGAADQYVLDYARCFGLPAVVFRMSCIYGPHQLGSEDQGWVAHFVIRALDGQPLTLYGDGKQVRDVLFVEDLVDALLHAQANAQGLSGRAFNVGGGPANTISLLELLDLVRELHGELPPVRFSGWRAGDQKHYVSDIRALRAATGWSPAVGVREGVARTYEWLLDTRGLPLPAPEASRRHVPAGRRAVARLAEPGRA